MRLLLLGAATASLLAATAASAQPVSPPSSESGKGLATRLCSGCHAIDAAGAATPRGDVPSFATIARLPNTTPERLAGAIIIPHPAMPGIPLTRAEIRDVIAYIMSLKP